VKNFVETGDNPSVVAPSGGTTAGLTYKIGSLIGVAASTVAAGAQVVLARKGVFDLVKVASQAWSQGDLLYWDDTAKNWTKTSTSNTKQGIAAQDQLSADVIGRVILVPSI
jgi:predicted RecA/RadA family phage recombinase